MTTTTAVEMTNNNLLTIEAMAAERLRQIEAQIAELTRERDHIGEVLHSLEGYIEHDQTAFAGVCVPF